VTSGHELYAGHITSTAVDICGHTSCVQFTGTLYFCSFSSRVRVSYLLLCLYVNVFLSTALQSIFCSGYLHVGVTFALRYIIQSEFLPKVILECLCQRKLCMETHRFYSLSRTFEIYFWYAAIFIIYVQVRNDCYHLRTGMQLLL
jgi:hypothetical protein